MSGKNEILFYTVDVQETNKKYCVKIYEVMRNAISSDIPRQDISTKHANKIIEAICERERGGIFSSKKEALLFLEKLNISFEIGGTA